MQKNSAPTEQPFWVDDSSFPSLKPFGKSSSWTSKITYNLSLALRILALGFFIYMAIKQPILWIAVIFFIPLVALRIYIPIYLKNKAGNADPAAIQKLAKERTGADIIGSAIHTAGHPLLQTDQKVVLALKGSDLTLYGYESPVPLDTISAKDIQSVNTVTYNEDRVPHIGVADNTAQALQLTFTFRGNPCTCVFRRMYKVRAIEWYQAFQKARLL